MIINECLFQLVGHVIKGGGAAISGQDQNQGLYQDAADAPKGIFQ